MDKAGSKPWFIAVGLHRPHDPFLCPKKYFDLYPPEALKLYRDPADMTPAPKLAIPAGMLVIFQGFSDRERLEFLRAYYACTSFMDAQVGRVLSALEQRKLGDRTVILFLGDNGYHLGERDWWNKVTLFERSCRVPLIAAGPGVARGKECSSLVELVDLYPTILEVCGVKAPHRLAGQSLVPLFRDPSSAGKPAAFTTVTRGTLTGRSVRTERWRYTEWDQGRQGIELYDEKNDPEETHDLSRDRRQEEIIASLRTLLAR